MLTTLAPQGWPTSLRRAFALAAVIGELATTGHDLGRPAPGRHGAAELVCRDSLWLLDARGSADAIGRDAGTLLAGPTRRLFALMRRSPTLLLAETSGAGASMAHAVPAPYQEETRAWAEAAGCDPELLLRVNAMADCCCTALVAAPDQDHHRPLSLARNLDFFPAGALGRSTVISVLHRKGARSIASVGWSGFTGVLSGMNSAGLCACVLLNMTRLRRRAAGMPIAYAVRQVLEQSDALEAAVSAFATMEVATSHYLLLADASGACVAWHGPTGFERHDARDGWLACSNGQRSAAGAAVDDRGHHLTSLAQAAHAVDESWLRSAISSTFLPGINAQAMLMTPARQRLQLALGDACHPAAGGTWRQLDLGPALAGGPLSACPVLRLGRPLPRQHYTDQRRDRGRKQKYCRHDTKDLDPVSVKIG